MVLMISALLILMFPVAVVVHEGTHYVLYTVEGIPVTSFHVLDGDALSKGFYGYVTTNMESKFGPLGQELAAYSAEYLFLISSMLILMFTALRNVTIRQLRKMGIDVVEKTINFREDVQLKLTGPEMVLVNRH
jgi:hypothetical protein